LDTHEISWRHVSYSHYGSPPQASTMRLENYWSNWLSYLQFSADPRTCCYLARRPARSLRARPAVPPTSRCCHRAAEGFEGVGSSPIARGTAASRAGGYGCRSRDAAGHVVSPADCHGQQQLSTAALCHSPVQQQPRLQRQGVDRGKLRIYMRNHRARKHVWARGEV
jgi:hypothetical protein